MDAQRTLDARGLKCPMPIIRAKKEIDATPPDMILQVIAIDPGSVLDFQVGQDGNQLRAPQAGGRDGRAGPKDVHSLPAEKVMTTAHTEIDPAIKAYVDERIAGIA